jgi:prepilin-type N-terminal cleavage/methylation domain-containing protein
MAAEFRWRARARERGLTLIEMIVTIAIITIGIIGISAGISQAHFIAGINQDQAQLEVSMRQLSDYVRDSSIASGLNYKLCAKSSDYSSANNSNFPSLPSKVTSWGVSAVTLSTAGTRNTVAIPPIQYCKTSGTCNSTNVCDWGVQEIALSVTNGLHTLTRTVWKSKT